MKQTNQKANAQIYRKAIGKTFEPSKIIFTRKSTKNKDKKLGNTHDISEHVVEAQRRSIQRLSTELVIRIMTSTICYRRIYRGTGRRRVPHPVRHNGVYNHTQKNALL